MTTKRLFAAHLRRARGGGGRDGLKMNFVRMNPFGITYLWNGFARSCRIPGYHIYQKWATVYRSTIYYDPFTLDRVGEGQSWDEYDCVFGYRKHGTRTINGQTSNWDTGWGWTGAQPGSSAPGYWPDRTWCGEAVEYQIQENNDPSGYTIDRQTTTTSEWALKNWAGVNTPGFEVIVGHDLEEWPYYHHYYNALPVGERLNAESDQRRRRPGQ